MVLRVVAAVGEGFAYVSRGHFTRLFEIRNGPGYLDSTHA